MTTHELSKILYAEDDPDIREVAKLSLEAVGNFTVEWCESGADVVDKARAFQPDLILLDVMMPRVDGPGALLALRKTPDLGAIPVVFMTAKAMTTEIEQLKEMGAADVITKPFDPMALPGEIEQIWSALGK